MNETRVTPRIAVLDANAPRLEQALVPVEPPPPGGPGSAALVLSGAAILVLGLTGLDVGNFVADQFARSTVLGWATLAVAVAGFGAIAAAIWRELRGVLGLRHVDHIRLRLADPATAQAAALDWLNMLQDGTDLRDAIAAVRDPEAIAALLRAGVATGLRQRARSLGRDAALQMMAATAAIPSPALDGLLVAWRGIRLIREVAALHGLRPGVLGTLSLLRRTAFSAAAVTAANMAVDAAARALLSNRMTEAIAGDVAGAAVAGQRMIVLASAAAAACTPVTE